MATQEGQRNPSVARRLSASEAADLAAIALALPDSWCVWVEPPYGQLAFGPRATRPRYHRAWVAFGSERVITRSTGLPSGLGGRS